MIEEVERLDAGKLIWGIVLIAVGALLALERLGVVEIDALWRYWPMIMICLGLAQMIRPKCPADRGSGVWLLLIGLWLQANMISLFGLTFSNSWPLLLVAVGLSMVLGSLIPQLSPEGGAEDSGK